MPRSLIQLCFGAVLLGAAIDVPVASAQGAVPNAAVTARAEALFVEGKQRLVEQDFARACPALEESHRIDPATGTLLALAICRKGEGKLATAARAFREAAQRAEREGRADRAAAARTEADALDPTLSRVTVVSQEPLDRITLSIDGAQLVPSQLGVELPLDGGDHTIEARRGSESIWSTRVVLAPSGDEKHVHVPALPASLAAAATKTVAVAVPPLRAEEPSRPRSRSSDAHATGLTTGQWAGVITAGTALVAAGIGTGFAIRAAALDDESARGCNGDLCSANARRKRLDARAAGDVATGAFLASASLATVGVVLFFSYPRRAPDMDTAARGIDAWVSADGAGATLRGSF